MGKAFSATKKALDSRNWFSGYSARLFTAEPMTKSSCLCDQLRYDVKKAGVLQFFLDRCGYLSVSNAGQSTSC